METQITNEQKYEDELLAVNWHLESACNYACDFCYAPLIEQRKLPGLTDSRSMLRLPLAEEAES